jgi:hypothetical protein
MLARLRICLIGMVDESRGGIPERYRRVQSIQGEVGVTVGDGGALHAAGRTIPARERDDHEQPAVLEVGL